VQCWLLVEQRKEGEGVQRGKKAGPMACVVCALQC